MTIRDTIRKTIRNTIKGYLLSKNYVLLNYGYPKKTETIKLVRSLGDRLHMVASEAYQLCVLVRSSCQKRKGNLAEVGTWRGGSAKLICEIKGDNPLYLFDTFEGLPKISEFDTADNKLENSFMEGEWKADYEGTKNYLKEYKNVKIYKGLFPGTSKDIINKKFIFVHFDVDIYKSTLDCLKFFYKRMECGGVILLHDYSVTRGVRKAVDEFFKDKPEIVIELSGTQALIVKL